MRGSRICSLHWPHDFSIATSGGCPTQSNHFAFAQAWAFELLPVLHDEIELLAIIVVILGPWPGIQI